LFWIACVTEYQPAWEEKKYKKFKNFFLFCSVFFCFFVLLIYYTFI